MIGWYWENIDKTSFITEAELEEQMRQLQAEEAIRHMGIINQYVHT